MPIRTRESSIVKPSTKLHMEAMPKSICKSKHKRYSVAQSGLCTPNASPSFLSPGKLCPFDPLSPSCCVLTRGCSSLASGNDGYSIADGAALNNVDGLATENGGAGVSDGVEDEYAGGFIRSVLRADTRALDVDAPLFELLVRDMDSERLLSFESVCMCFD